MAKPTKESIAAFNGIKKGFRGCTEFFHAMGDPFRQDIVLLLATRERLNVNEITEHIALSRPAVSHHLKVLLLAKLVTVERVSRENFYSLSMEKSLINLQTLIETINAACSKKINEASSK
jgi:ArsR family transcriptional regulator, arsenate/arsenite/antimonite-responsive transcriptional repressor